MGIFQQQHTPGADHLQTLIQPQLETGKKDDEQEKEADTVAGKVMRMPYGDDEGGTIRKMGEGGAISLRMKEERDKKMPMEAETNAKMKPETLYPVLRKAGEENETVRSESAMATGDKNSVPDKTGIKSGASEIDPLKIWKKDRKDDGTELSYSTEAEAQLRLTDLEKKGRWKEYAIKSSADKKKWWIEMNGPQRIFRIAWTIDDGPQGSNTEKMKTVGLGGEKNVTWYIQRNKIYGKPKMYTDLKTIQDNGGEIAIHSFHPTAEHSTWFPIAEKYNPGAYSTPYEGKKEAVIMADLESFYKELKGYGIRVKFVRLPGGLYSELIAYAKTKGITDKTKNDPIVRAIIAGKDISSFNEPAAAEIKTDFDAMKSKLSDLDLLEWQGTTDPNFIGTMSWQSETSGVAARSDNTTKLIAPAAKTTVSEAGKFEKKLDSMEAKNEKEGSLVILAHDSSTADADAVAQDKKEIERLSEIRGVTVENHTMSSLFNAVTKKDINSFDVQYPK